MTTPTPPPPAAAVRRRDPTARPPGPHADLVLRLLHRHGPLTRGELGALSGLTRTTLHDVVGALVDGGSVTASVPKAAARGRGRPPERLALNPGTGRAVGIEFARAAVRVAATTAVRGGVATASAPHSPGVPWPRRVALARALAAELAGDTRRWDFVTGVGIALPAPFGASAPGGRGAVDHRALAASVGRAFGCRVRLERAARLAMLAESVWGAARGREDVLYVALSHTVGGGLMTGGTLHRGAHGLSGEFGHIVAEPGGAPCVCGRRGCLQTLASTPAVLRAAGVADVPALLAALGGAGSAARSALGVAAVQVGRVLAGLVTALNTGTVVVGGELAAAGPALLEPLEQELRANAMRGAAWPPLLVCPAELGDFAAARGAVALLGRAGCA
ncbi:ROK family protein [Streptomyces sp. NPDC050560]|uniref:ROK family transcriptional regulator n=1 Tax=Streptomyces sp. NPDC050560 TaxID=3365630 RepID=UPI0037B481E2